MENTNTTVIVALITAIAAVLAPAISSIIASILTLKSTRISATLNKRIELTKQLNEEYRKMVQQPNYVTYPQSFYSIALELASLCTKHKTRTALIDLATSVKSNHDSDENNQKLESCMILLAKEV